MLRNKKLVHSVHIIGSEVPFPGEAGSTNKEIQVTSVSYFLMDRKSSRSLIKSSGCVVQPGVEFADIEKVHIHHSFLNQHLSTQHKKKKIENY
ncbi:hypothetical protein CI105_06905 [Candidatus Izimaplasma bacterium ZiA1]|uniref:class II D-tagatose-bisphosphate aldolase non-catalytic subunit n=1 Tax=Candidatus Izimoplasma sp. ZiA1 TaxID=2024899 RepID=UPI000BAA79A7|nr:hypothetical protein CI105_06905 [Candidatus Izimaplasma bacterium ZiA1]